MLINLPKLVLLTFTFKALKPINNLPHYHGAQWSALIRNIIKSYFPSNYTMSDTGIWIHSVETGILSYQKDDVISLGITFPVQHLSSVSRIFREFNNIKCGEGHFQPGKTIILEDIYCRITDKIWGCENTQYLSEEIIKDEIDMLSKLNEFTIHFYSPLRLPRPKGYKAEGHHYSDEDFFLSSPQKSLPINHLINKIRLKIPDPENEYFGDINIVDGALTWLDMFYGEGIIKTIGGVVGKIKAKGRPQQKVAELLVAGQYLGAGKNPAFGFGFYNIPEIDAVKKIKQLSRGNSILQRAMSVQFIKDTLNKLPNTSPGPDGLTVADIKKAGDRLIENLSSSVIKGEYKQGDMKKYRLPKDDGSFREIFVQNVTDRLIHKTTADYLLPVIDRLLSVSSYAYRRGLNRNGAAAALRTALSEGYTSGLKADISAFFDSVNIEFLFAVLDELFPFEPLIKRINTWLMDAQKSGIKGLPQGSPLSPLLSNLYLDRFDRDMEKEGFRLIRYADDFVLLFKDDLSYKEGREKVEKSLAKLGLQLKYEKTTEIKGNTPISFLGYVITQSDIVEAEKDSDTDKEKEEWLSLFKDEWLAGTPVYLTSICRGAYSRGAYLVIKTTEDGEDKIPWNRISRVIIVGRSPFSGGVVYRAVKEDVPVTFIDVMGRARGHLYPEYNEMPDILSLQHQFSKDTNLCLSFAREIISAKIHNSIVLLRRNSIDSEPMKEIEQRLKSAEEMETLRGFEGAAAKLYYLGLANLVTPFEFKGRVYHPPDSPVNVLLSLGYTLIYNRISSVLRDKGFNPRIGFFHKGRGLHSALASDLLEELRHIAERIMLSLIHRREIKPEDFSIVQKKGVNICRLLGDGFRKYINRFETTMAAKSSYHGGEKMSYNNYLDEIADNLKRSLKLKISYRALRID